MGVSSKKSTNPSLINIYCLFFIDCVFYAPYAPFCAVYHLLYPMPYPEYSTVFIPYSFTVFLNHFLTSSSSWGFVPVKHCAGWFHRFGQKRSNQWNPLVKWLVGTKLYNLQSLDGTRMRTTAPHQSLHKTVLFYAVRHAVCSISSE